MRPARRPLKSPGAPGSVACRSMPPALGGLGSDGEDAPVDPHPPMSPTCTALGLPISGLRKGLSEDHSVSYKLLASFKIEHVFFRSGLCVRVAPLRHEVQFFQRCLIQANKQYLYQHGQGFPISRSARSRFSGESVFRLAALKFYAPFLQWSISVQMVALHGGHRP